MQPGLEPGLDPGAERGTEGKAGEKHIGSLEFGSEEWAKVSSSL